MKIKELFNRQQARYSVKVVVAWLWSIWQGNRLQALLNVLVGVLSVVNSLMQIWAVQHAIDVAAGSVKGSIYWSVAFMGLLILIGFGLNIASIWISNVLGIKAQNRMQQQMLDRILRSQWHGKGQFHSGDILNRLEIDVRTVVSFLTETLPSTVSFLAMFIGAFLYLMMMDATLALLIVAMIPVFIVLSKLYMGRMRHFTAQVRSSDSKVQSILQETIQHRMLIKTLESIDQMVNRLESTQHTLRQRVMRRTVFNVFSNLILSLGFSLGYLLAFLWAAVRMIDHSLSFGGMVAFLQLVNRIQSPARSLTKLVPAFVEVLTAAERLMELEENPLEKQGKAEYFDAPCGIKLNNISYAYDDEPDRKVINNLSFDFYPGSCTAVLGETGAGKTTLIRMLLALIEPTEGSVSLYDKYKTKTITPLMRANISYVPQGNTLMSGTIKENLLLGNPFATMEEMEKALTLSCAQFVFELPEGLETVVTEQGGGLSEGQAQRICIARALLRDRSIMIFDEATSALDPDTERQLLHNILENQTKTIIFITHRPAVIDYCNQSLNIIKEHEK